MTMDPTPFLIMGALLGCSATLLVQWYARRKVRQATATQPEPDRAVILLANENERQMAMISRLEERISVMERIAPDAPARLGHAIDALR
jgi:hypothetical protein